MHGLTARWSLEGAPDGAEEALSTDVRDTSHPRFTGKAGLRSKRVEPCRVVAVAEGGSGFLSAPTYA